MKGRREPAARWCLSVLALVALGLWVVSAFVEIGRTSWDTLPVGASAGRVALRYGCLYFSSFRGLRGYEKLELEVSEPMSVYLYWTYEAYYRSGYNSVVETRRIPLWPLVVVLATADLVVWVRWARSKRRSNTNCCEGCGYDRRGLAADATCPECGSAPAPKQPA